MRTIPSSMLAAVYRGPGDMRLETVPVPTIGPGEVLVEVAACGVCGTDLKKIQLGLQPAPRIFGHETVGRIAHVGPGVDEWSVGQRVALYHHIPCRRCHFCRRGVASQCAVYKRTGVTAGFEPAGGGFAQYVRALDWIVAGGGLVAVPDDVTDDQASFIEPVNTGLKAVARAEVREGDAVFVIGAGPIGLMLAQLALSRGARAIIADLLPGRRALAERLGATAVEPDGAREAILAASDGRGADAVFLAVPHSGLVATALALARPGGRVVLFAQTRPNDPFEADAGEIGVLDKHVLGSYSSDVELNEAAAEAVFNQRLDVASLVTHHFGLDQIQMALDVAGRPADNSLKVIIKP